jgi:dihydroxyacetone kinase-like predicted kinase
MADAAGSVLAGELTQAVRDTTSELGPISEGDWIGIVRGDGIVSVAGDLLAAGQRLLDHLLADGRELLTLVAGRDAAELHTQALSAWLATTYPMVQVEVHHGGQPLYPYLFGAE